MAEYSLKKKKSWRGNGKGKAKKISFLFLCDCKVHALSHNMVPVHFLTFNYKSAVLNATWQLFIKIYRTFYL